MSDENRFHDQIRNVLQDHEEPYVLGSWERFEKHKERKIRKQRNKFIFRSAAAILLILLSSVYLWTSMSGTFSKEQITQDSPESVQEQPVYPDESETLSDHQSETGEEQPVYNGESEMLTDHAPDTVMEQSVTEESAATPSSFLSNGEQRHIASHTSAASRETEQHDTDPNESIAHVALPSLYISDPSFYLDERENSGMRGRDPEQITGMDPALKIRTEEFTDVITKEDLKPSGSRGKTSPLTFSVAYASAMNIHDSQTEPGSGAGVYAGWNFAPGFTLSTGLAVSQNSLTYSDHQDGFLTASYVSEMETSGMEFTTMAGDHLSSVHVNLLNLEIPLDVRYHLSNQFSISAGVSSVTFLREQYNYNFEFAHRTQSFGSQQSEQTLSETIVTHRTTHKQSEPALDAVNWGAFYIFSVGYQHEIFSRYTASFEPFVKIPAGEVTSRGVRYTTGGLQLRLSF